MTLVFRAGVWTEDGAASSPFQPECACAPAPPSSTGGRQEVFVVAEGALPALPLAGPAICIELLGNGNRRMSFTDGAA